MAHAFLRTGPEKDLQSAPRAARLVARAFPAMALLIGMGGWVEARTDGGAKPADAISPEAAEFFEARIRPILVEKCVSCHGPKKQSSSLRLDSREAMLKGGDSGPAIVPSRPEESLVIQAVAHRHEELKMPPKGKLPDAEVAMLSRWVAMGAPWPANAKAASAGADAAAEHWAFRPVRPAPAPTVKDRSWVQSPVDAFVLARLEAKGIAPSPPADRRTLIRRATIDLWGIPPTPEEVEAFEADPAPDAFARVVDRLLASPRYGERWGRHWLDVARYADTKGYVFTQERRYPYSFTYRDYVIDAFNADLP
jgi:mono/diheme cytochrome c family protein